MVEFQCAVAARQRDEPLFATASQVHRWLLVEVRGAWGRDAVADSDLARYATAEWRTAPANGGHPCHRHPARPRPHAGGGLAALLRRVRRRRRAGGELDVPRRHAAGRCRGLRRPAGDRRGRRLASAPPTAGAGVHERSARSLLRHVRTPARAHPARVAPTRRRVGVLAHRWGPLRRQRRHPSRGPLLRPLRRPVGGAASRRLRATGTSTSTTTAAAASSGSSNRPPTSSSAAISASRRSTQSPPYVDATVPPASSTSTS